MKEGWLATEHDDIVLRPYGWEMLGDLVPTANHREISLFMGDSFRYPYTEADAREYLEMATNQDPTQHYAVIVEGEFVGGVGYTAYTGEQSGSVHMGWWLTPSSWHKGIMAIAGRALRDDLFINRGVMRIGAPVMHANPASARVAEKIGMRLEGVAPSMYVKFGVRYDQLNFGVTREQWLELRSAEATA
jgi:RimJ/RimL family protein N-acetyltransferase